MKLRLVLLVCLFLASPLLVGDQSSQEAAPLSLNEAINTALEHHPRMLRAQLQISRAETRAKQARSAYFPQVDAGGTAKQGLSGSGNLFGLHGLASSPEPDDMAVSVNVYQDLYDFGRANHENAARRAELLYFQESVRTEKAGVKLNVQKAYYANLKAQHLIELAEETIEERKLTLRQAEAFFRAQLRAKLDVNLARLALSRAELDLVKAQNSLEHAFADLNEAMGIEAPHTYRLQEPSVKLTPPSALESLLAEALESRPELGALQARFVAMEEWLRRAESERYPRLMGVFSGGWTRFAELAIGKLLFGGFGIKLPIFTGGRLKASIEEAQQKVEETKIAQEELIQIIRLQVTRAHSDLITTIESAKTGAQLVQQAKEALRLARVRYRMELSDFVDLTVARTSVTAAESEHARTLYDYKTVESELQYATGRY